MFSIGIDRDAWIDRLAERTRPRRRRPLRRTTPGAGLPSRGPERLEPRVLLATTIHVTQTSDAVAFNPAASPSTTANAAGPVSLRSAIGFVDHQSATQLASNGPYVIVFDVNGTFTNTLPANSLQDDTGGQLSIFNPNGDLGLTIQGNGAANTIIDGNSIDSVFLISPSGHSKTTTTSVTLTGVTIQHGLSRADNGGAINFEAVTSNADHGNFTGTGSLTVRDSVIGGNHAAAVANGFGGNGGAIFVGTNALQDTPVSLTVANSTIANNTADRGGGGIEAVNAHVTIQGSTLSQNHANLFDATGLGGGAIALNGGAKLNLTAANTTIDGNDTAGDGGGIVVSGLAGSPAVTLTNVTIADNRANKTNGVHQGGGISVQAGIVTLGNTIVARNFVGSAGTTGDDVKGSLAAASTFNLFGNGGSGGLSATNGNQVNVASPGLGTLGSNGGSTQTVPLLLGSPALDAGSNALATAASLTSDQRGGTSFPRVADGPDADATQTTDIGAFEADPSVQLVPNQSVVHDQSGSVVFNIGDGVFAAPNPTITSVTATSDNQAVQPDAGLSISGSSSTRTLSYTPAAGQVGTAHVTVTVTASNGQSMATTFTLNVTDRAPTVSNFSKSGTAGADVTFAAADFTGHFADADAGDTLQSIRIDTLPTAASGTLKLSGAAVAGAQVIPLAQLGNLTFTPAQAGSQAFTWSASDGVLFASADATVTLNVTAQADLAVTKSGPASAVAGTTITYTVSVTNNGPGAATNATLSDTLPAGEALVSQSQDNGPAFTLASNGNAIGDTIASLASGQTATFTIVALVGTGVADNTSLSSTASVTSSTGDPGSANNSATAATTVSARADLALTKTGPASVTAGSNITYTVTVANNGPSDAQSVTLADALPAGTSFVSQNQDSGPVFTTNIVGNAISDTIATLPAGSSATFTIVALVSPSVADGTSLSNTADASSSTTDPTPGNNNATAATAVNTRADLAVTKIGPASVIAGTTLIYTVTLTNNGPSDAQAVVLADTLPAGLTFVSQNQVNGPAFATGNNGDAISDTIATLAAGASASFTIVASVGAGVANGSTLSNTASSSSGTTDPVAGNNSATATTTVSARADLAVTKTGPARVIAGTSVTYTVTVTNNGPSDAQAVTLSDNLPAGISFVSQSQGSGPLFTLGHNGGSISDTIAALPAGASATFTFVAQVGAGVADGSSLSDTASATTTTSDTVAGNNSATSTTTVAAQADLAVTKTGPATAVAGTNVTYTVTLTNNGPSDAQTVALSDTLPAGTTFVSQAQDAGPAFALSHVGDAISDTIGTLASGASATFTFVAQVAANVVNNATLGNTAAAVSATADPVPGNNDATATTTVIAQADVVATESGPAMVTAGTNITYTMTVTNNGPSDAQGVVLADTLPAGTSFLSQNQNTGPAFTLGQAGNAINDTIATLAAGSSAMFTIVAQVAANVPDGATLSNSASASSSTTDPAPGNNTGTATTTVSTQADLAVAKTAPATVVAGMNITYTVTVTNNGPSDAQAVALADMLPTGTSFVSQAQNSGPAVTLGHAGNAISDTIATLAAGASASVTFVALVNPNVAGGAMLGNTATVGSTTSDPASANNSATVSTTVSTLADLAVTKTAPAAAVAGKTITYTVTVSNSGPSDAQSVTLADSLPAGLVFVSQSQGSGPAFTLVNAGNAIRDTIAALPAGAAATFTFVAALAANLPNRSTLVNMASGSSTTADPVGGNNASTASTLVLNEADLSVVTTAPATVSAVGLLTYTVTVTNNGPSDAQSVALADTLPAAAMYLSQSQTSGPAFSPGHAGNAITDTVATLTAGSTATFTIVVQVKGSQANRSTMANTATVTTATVDPNAANNASTASTTVLNFGILLLDRTGKDSLSVSGLGTVAATDPGAIVVDSNNAEAALVTGNATVLSSEIDVTGGTKATGQGKFLGPITHPAPSADPLGLPPPPVPATNRPAVNVSGGSLTLHPGTYHGGIKASGQASVTLTPGVYYLKGGGLSVSGQAHVVGNGVLIVNVPNTAADVVTVSGLGVLTLTPYASVAPNDPYAAYRGIALMQPAPFKAPISVSGLGNLAMTGRLYAPAATLDLQGAGVATIKSSAGQAFPGGAILADLTVSGAAALYVDVNPSSETPVVPGSIFGGMPPSGAWAAALGDLISGGVSPAILSLTDPTILTDLAATFVKNKKHH